MISPNYALQYSWLQHGSVISGMSFFRAWLKAAITTRYGDGRSVISPHEDRPNNWGNMAGASRIAADLYLGDTAALTLVLAMLLPGTPLSNFGRLVAVMISSVLVALFGLNSVEIVQDVGEIPRGIPTPVVPSLSNITLDVITGALAVAVVILVQGAGVSQSVPNPDGSRRRRYWLELELVMHFGGSVVCSSHESKTISK